MATPAHYDMTIFPGGKWDNLFIWPVDLIGSTITFVMNDKVLYSTDDLSLPVQFGVPNEGETTIAPVFTPAQTKTMKPGSYRIMVMYSDNTEDCIFEGAVIV